MTSRPLPQCKFKGCDRVAATFVTRLCDGHRTQKRQGRKLSPLRSRTTAENLGDKLKERMAVDEDTGCWVWTGALSNEGYGAIWFDGRRWQAHRAAYQAWIAPVDPILVVHHACANRACINPQHLSSITQRENIAEMLERHSYQKEIVRLKAQLQKCTCGAGEAA